MYDASHTIAAFLDAAAAKQPAPGGGSVTALAGALAAAMGEMVVNYSLGKKNLAAHQPELQSGLAELSRAREILLGLMAEDQVAFDLLSELRKLPDDAPQRREQLPAALLACIRVPETMAATGVAVLALAGQLVDRVNFYLLSDLAVCAELAMATVRCGLYNVRVNLPDLDDASDQAAANVLIASLSARALGLVREVVPRIWARHAGGK